MTNVGNMFGAIEFERHNEENLTTFSHALDMAFVMGKHERSREFAALINQTSFGV